MANFTSGGWPSGATVNVYAASGTVDGGLAAPAPSGAVVATGTASSTGSVTFTGLAEDTGYVASDGSRHVSVRIPRTSALTTEANGDVTVRDGSNFVFDTTTGTKFGTATTQKLAFYNSTPVVKPTVTGSRGANAALASLLTQLAALGLVVDSSSA